MKLIHRDIYVDKVLNYLGKGLIVVLTGQRRVGKSCILQSVAQSITEIEPTAHIIYINKEFSEFEDIKTYRQLTEYVDGKLESGGRNYLFIDEVQDIEHFENAVRNYHAKDACDIIITGSNAKMLSSELSTYLSGRYVEIHINSLNYKEFLLFHKMQDSDSSLHQYLTYGGLPQLAQIGLQNRQMVSNYLSDIYNTVIMKDVITRENIRNVRFLEDLVRFTADNTGKNISAHSISKFMKSQNITVSPTLVTNYLDYLCNAYIMKRARRFDLHGKKLLETNEKYYFEDVGLRNHLTGTNLRRDIEKILENVVYLHLCQQGYAVNVGLLQKSEIDFVAEKDGKRLYVQVCYQLANQETIDREFGNLQKISDAYPKWVVCMDRLAAQGGINGIDCLYLSDFLLKTC